VVKMCLEKPNITLKSISGLINRVLNL